MPDSIDAVKKDLSKWFHGMTSTSLDDWNGGIEDSPFFEDYARIGSYLSDPNQYRHALEQLHAEMEARLNRNLDEMFAAPLYPHWRNGFIQLLKSVYQKLDTRTRRMVDRGKVSMAQIAIAAFRNILTGPLEENERKNGFQVGTYGKKIDILIGSPTGLEFNTFLRKKQVFKDLSAGKEHGENSHRIQWYLISKLGTLANPVADIYASLPDWKTAKIGSRPFFLWEFLVDRDGVPSNAESIPFKTLHQSDFRAPSNVNRWLTDGRVPDLDLLTLVLSNRWERRTGEAADVYLARKMKLNWNDLLPEEQEEFSKAVVLKGQVPTATEHGKHRIFRR
ncbi:MAG TPA: LirA/MavJ family T4SS effector [Candidatus Eisenbacteria bacterium]|nr:LirA/MavJ family T4SS effector [Candidatus Eisenbacteria bacterium]